MLRLEHVDAGYGETQVLWDVSLEAARGKMTVIIGPNGAGKSTILKVVTGLVRLRGVEVAPPRGQGGFVRRLGELRSLARLRPGKTRAASGRRPGEAGRVVFDDEDITRLPAHDRPSRGIACCPEGRRLFPAMTTEANLRIGAYTPRARQGAAETLEHVYGLFPRLRERARVKAGRLSGGEQQMVGIGRALMAKPSLLVLDEPSLGLAPLVVTEIFETIRRLREEGLTVLMVEQNAFQALRIADFGHVVQGGRVVRSGEPSKLLDLEQLRKDYFALT